MLLSGRTSISNVPRLSAGGIALGAVLTLASCTHPQEEMVVPETPVRTVQLSLAVDLRYDGHVYDMSSVYEDDFGHAFVLDTLRFLASGAQALAEGDVLLADYSSVYLMVDCGQPDSEFLLGELTASSLHEIAFSLGLPPAMNHADPTLASPPLNDMTMHSGSMALGYSFLHVAGRVDSNADGVIDDNDQRFSYRCIGDALMRPALAYVHADVPDGGALTAPLPINMEILLADIDLLNTPSTVGDGAVNWAWLQRLMEAMEQEH